MDGDAGLCAISGVGVFAAMIVVSPSSRQTGQTVRLQIITNINSTEKSDYCYVYNYF